MEIRAGYSVLAEGSEMASQAHGLLDIPGHHRNHFYSFFLLLSFVLIFRPWYSNKHTKIYTAGKFKKSMCYRSDKK